MEVEEVSPDGKKFIRVKELEKIVKKLEEENKQLLNEVRTASPTFEHGQLAATESEINLKEDLESGILNLNNIDLHSKPEGEWLFVSPKLTLTPAQRKQTPQQWLSDGHDHDRDESIPSLDEVKKTLVFNMEEAETASNMVYPRPKPANITAQHYLNRVRGRSIYNTDVVHTETRNSVSSPGSQRAGVPQASKSPTDPKPVAEVVWDPNSASTDDEIETQENVSGNETVETVPIVKWKANARPKAKTPQDHNSDIPVVNWKAKMPQGDSSPEDNSVSVIKPKSNTPAGRYEPGKSLPAPKRITLMKPGDTRQIETSQHEGSQVASDDSKLKPKLRLPHTSNSPSQPLTSLQSRQTGIPGLRRPAEVTSPVQTQVVKTRSPSPSNRQPPPHAGRQLARPRTKSSPSQPSHTLDGRSSGGSRSPKTSRQKVETPSISRAGGYSPKSTPEESGQHMSLLQAHREGQAASPQTSLRPPGGLRGPSSLSPRRRELTQTKDGSRLRRVLPTPPLGEQKGSQPSSLRSTQQPPQPTLQQGDDSWLEGCF